MKISVTDREGNKHELEGDTNSTLMEILRDAGLDIEASCGGCCACATCHVYIDKKWLSKINPINEDEESMLDQVFDVRDSSRLSCQIDLSEDLDGIEHLDTPLFSHTYSHHHSIYRFNNVKISKNKIIGKEGSGMSFTHSWFRHERLGIAARCCGAAERLIAEATDFAKERESFGDKISNYQSIQNMLADSVTELASTRLLLYEVCKAHDAKEDVKVLHAKCSMIKLNASEMANRVADRAVQIFGGRGYMRENVAERFYRELRADRIWEGTSEIQRIIIANSLYKRGLENLI